MDFSSSDIFLKFRFRKKVLLFCAVIVILAFGIKWANGLVKRGGYEPLAGDVLYQSLDEEIPFVAMIEGVTESPLSHCGIVVRKDGEWMVLEAIGEVRYMPLQQWIMRGQDHWYSAYRLQGEYAGAGNAEKMVEAAKVYAGRPYDYRFLEDDEHIYCSELVYKSFYGAFGVEPVEMQTLKDLNWKPFTFLIMMVEGSPKLPFDRKMISPHQMSKSRYFKQVFTKKRIKEHEKRRSD